MPSRPEFQIHELRVGDDAEQQEWHGPRDGEPGGERHGRREPAIHGPQQEQHEPRDGEESGGEHRYVRIHLWTKRRGPSTLAEFEEIKVRYTEISRSIQRGRFRGQRRRERRARVRAEEDVLGHGRGGEDQEDELSTRQGDQKISQGFLIK